MLIGVNLLFECDSELWHPTSGTNWTKSCRNMTINQLDHAIFKRVGNEIYPQGMLKVKKWREEKVDNSGCESCLTFTDYISLFALLNRLLVNNET